MSNLQDSKQMAKILENEEEIGVESQSERGQFDLPQLVESQTESVSKIPKSLTKNSSCKPKTLGKPVTLDDVNDLMYHPLRKQSTDTVKDNSADLRKCES